MIQFKRGSRASWLRLKKPLADGQPGYDKERHKIKIGNGKDLWSALPYASGLSKEEIFDKESKAKARSKANAEDKTIITYGATSPDDGTIGQLYLQYYDADPEVDYVVSYGINNGWTFQKWKSGLAKCCGTFNYTTTVQSAIDNSSLYQSSSNMAAIKYPFTFKEIPNETATIHSDGGFVWLASNKGLNTKSASASYCIVSPDKLTNSSTYKVALSVEGTWK
jgi:hypothetical protein